MRLRIPGLSLIAKFNDWVMGAKESDSVTLVLYDRTLLWLTFGLAIVGFVMVTSASVRERRSPTDLKEWCMSVAKIKRMAC